MAWLLDCIQICCLSSPRVWMSATIEVLSTSLFVTINGVCVVCVLVVNTLVITFMALKKRSYCSYIVGTKEVVPTGWRGVDLHCCPRYLGKVCVGIHLLRASVVLSQSDSSPLFTLDPLSSLLMGNRLRNAAPNSWSYA